MPQGMVQWFNAEKGFGFIMPDGGMQAVFVHHASIAGRGFRTLEEGERVEFDVAQGGKSPMAEKVRRLS